MKIQNLVKNNRIWTRKEARNFPEAWASEDEVLEFLYSFVRMIKPTFCLEIGTFEGDASISIAKALKENDDDGILQTADIKDFGQEKNIKDAGYSKFVKCFIANPPFTADFLLNAKCDFIWIDDGHSYDEVTRDLGIAHNLCIKDGYILGHDIVSIKTVRQAYNDFIAKYGNQYEQMTVTSYNGLFILKKK